MLFFVEFDGVLAQQVELPAAADRLQARCDGVGVDAVGVFALKPQQHRLVAAVALAGGAERAVQLDLDAGGTGQQVVAAQALGKTRGCAHRPDGM